MSQNEKPLYTLVEEIHTTVLKENKALNKENKRLRKERNELVHKYLSLYKTLALNQKPRPVAEFKCAKDNKPSDIGSYIVIVDTGDGDIRHSIADYRNKKWWHSYPVIAFSETDPKKIVRSIETKRFEDSKFATVTVPCNPPNSLPLM